MEDGESRHPFRHRASATTNNLGVPDHMKFEADTLISFYGGLVPAKMFIYRTYVVHF